MGLRFRESKKRTFPTIIDTHRMTISCIEKKKMSYLYKVKKKKPDQVVYNEEKGGYNASLMPYATNIGAPAIRTDDVTSWKNTNISKVNHQFKTEYEELKAKYDKMMEQFEYNNLIYSAKFSFEPIVGAVYHLYRSKDGTPFLSLISPEECDWDYAGTFELKADKIWDRLNTPKDDSNK